MASFQQLPPDLNVFLDFVAHDDRPTFVLEQSKPYRIFFRNAALDALIAHTTREEAFLSWVGTLSGFVVNHGRRARDECTFAYVGTFAKREWSSKRIRHGEGWIAVFCRQEAQKAASREFEMAGEMDIRVDVSVSEVLEDRDVSRQGADGIKRRRIRDIREPPAPGSDILPSIQDGAVTTEPKLDELVVDWLRHPELSADPWVHFIKNHTWAKTDIGPIETWPVNLRQIHSVIMSSTEPRVLYWGEKLNMFYNAAAQFLVGAMHPAPLGNPLSQVWGDEIHAELTDILRQGIAQGKPLHNRKREITINRNGCQESAYFDFTFIPVPSADGRFLGFINEFNETTASVVQENRHEVSKKVLENASRAKDLVGLWSGTLKTLEHESLDVSYAMLYGPVEINNSNAVPDTRPFSFQAGFGIDSQALDHTLTLTLTEALQGSPDEIVVLDGGALPVQLAVSVGDLGPVNTICILPISSVNSGRLAFIVLGITPTRPFNHGSQQFASSLRDLLYKSAALFSLPAEQRRIHEITAALSQQLQSVTLKAEQSEQNFTRMVHDAPIGMCMFRNDGSPIYINDGYLKLMGMTRTEFTKAAETGHPWRNAIFEEDYQRIVDIWQKALDDKKPLHIEFRVKSESVPDKGSWREAVTMQRYDANGKMVFLYGWLTDISSRKLTESLVVQRLQDALETKRASENFIDMVSHEMRNPLSSILQLADSIVMSVPEDEEATLSPEAQDSLIDAAQTIMLCAKHQKNIIDEVLTYSKLDSKLLVLAPERVQATAIVKSALKMVKAELEHADIAGSMHVDTSYLDLAVDYVLLDPGRLLQVIINLLTNAIKFTQASNLRRITIELSASRTRPTGKDCKVTLIEPRKHASPNDTQTPSVAPYQGAVGEEIFIIFSIKDTGCGLTEEEMKHLFSRFSQASPKTYKQYGGSGLGLFISRELTELQGGQIGVHSASGSGSVFAFYVKAARVEAPLDIPSRFLAVSPFGGQALPLTSPKCSGMSTKTTMVSRIGLTRKGSTEARRIAKAEVGNLHVLVVEDNAINQKVMAQQLRKMGCAEVHVADHGLDALTFLSKTDFFPPSSSSSTPIPLSVVLLDVEMPTMDGLTCARRIREAELKREIDRHVPIIGITANARTDQISACIEAGMDEVMTKPFRMPDLIPRMTALLDRQMPGA